MSVAEQVARVGDELVVRADGRPLEVWSSLAEGADRMVADDLVARGAALVAVLPLDTDDYRPDFATPDSLADFDRLLGAARQIQVAEPGDPSREAAYEAAGLAVLDAADVLVALWDGGPSRGRGGTADIVDAAFRQQREVIVVPVTRDNV